MKFSISVDMTCWSTVR